MEQTGVWIANQKLAIYDKWIHDNDNDNDNDMNKNKTIAALFLVTLTLCSCEPQQPTVEDTKEDLGVILSAVVIPTSINENLKMQITTDKNVVVIKGLTRIELRTHLIKVNNVVVLNGSTFEIY